MREKYNFNWGKISNICKGKGMQLNGLQKLEKLLV